MGRQPEWMVTQTGRPAMRSPGRPPFRREMERAFWVKIAQGMTSEDAGVAVGVSGPVGSRWFRDRGGMPSISLDQPSGRYLSFAEREEIALMRAQHLGVRQIARALGRDPSTISRELRRNAATRGGKLDYRAGVAQWKAELVARRAKTAKLVANAGLRDYVQKRLSGQVRRPDGVAVAGPTPAPWKGRNKPRRQERRWALAWSPEQIAHRLPIDFPDDASMRISHEAIYQALYVESRGALKRELVACLRTGRALRVPRSHARARPGAHVSSEVMTSERRRGRGPRRPRPLGRRLDHWLGALGNRHRRRTHHQVHDARPSSSRGGLRPHGPVKNGPPLGGYGAVSMKNALVATMSTMPEHVRRSLTWDRGKELSAHVAFRVETGTPVYFADPHSPWQRGTNENTNGLLRQYFPKGTDLSRWSAHDLVAVADALSSRPRKTLGWKTPAEAMNEHLLLLQQAGVATTG